MRNDSRPTGPVFVIGAPFFGYKALMWALTQHPAIAPVPASEWLNVLTTAVESAFAAGSAPGTASQLGRLGVNRGCLPGHVGGAGSSMVTAGTPPGSDEFCAQRWVPTSVECAHYAFGLWQVFPTARFIHSRAQGCGRSGSQPA